MHSNQTQANKTGWRILIAGTGGQGVLTAARLLCDCFAERGHRVVSGQLHGMAQRGGSVQSSVMIDAGISPVIPSGRADFVLGFEPVETARAMLFMSPHTIVYMNTAPVLPFVLAQRTVLKKGDADYPSVEGIGESIRTATGHLCALEATRYAEEAGSAQALNMVMLGCLLGSGSLPCKAETFWNVAEKRMPPASRETNAAAFRRGVEFAGALQTAGNAE